MSLTLPELHALSAVIFGAEVLDPDLDKSLRALAAAHPGVVTLREPQRRKGQKRALVYAEATDEGRGQILVYLQTQAGAGKTR